MDLLNIPDNSNILGTDSQVSGITSVKNHVIIFFRDLK